LRVARRITAGDRSGSRQLDAEPVAQEVQHQRAFTTLPVQNAELEFVLQTRGPAHIEEVLATLRAAGLYATTHPY